MRRARGKRLFFDAPERPIAPMSREMREHYHWLQVRHEQAGEWEQANRLNLWLTGAFASVADIVNDDVPLIRRHFLRRLCKSRAISK
jgi:hypothetical protein